MKPRDLPEHLLRIEYDWYRGREERRHQVDDQRETGVTSDAMVAYAIGDTEKIPTFAPLDIADLRACFRCRDNAPEHLHVRMNDVIAVYGARLALSYNVEVDAAEKALEEIRNSEKPKASAWRKAEARWKTAKKQARRLSMAMAGGGLAALDADPDVGPAPGQPQFNPTFKTTKGGDTALLFMPKEKRLVAFETVQFMRALRAGQHTWPSHSRRCSACDGEGWLGHKACATCLGYGREPLEEPERSAAA